MPLSKKIRSRGRKFRKTPQIDMQHNYSHCSQFNCITDKCFGNIKTTYRNYNVQFYYHISAVTWLEMHFVCLATSSLSLSMRSITIQYFFQRQATFSASAFCLGMCLGVSHYLVSSHFPFPLLLFTLK